MFIANFYGSIQTWFFVDMTFFPSYDKPFGKIPEIVLDRNYGAKARVDYRNALISTKLTLPVEQLVSQEQMLYQRRSLAPDHFISYGFGLQSRKTLLFGTL